MRASNSIVRPLLLVVLAGGCAAQSITVTSPANNSIVTTGWKVTAAVTSMPNVARVDFYVDSRLECSAASFGGTFSCSYRNIPWVDAAYEQVYAVAYDWLGNSIATSPINTFNIRNHGLNQVDSFSQTGGCTLPQVCGTLTWTKGVNATSTSNMGTAWALDGIDAVNIPGVYAADASINTSTATLTVDLNRFYTGMSAMISCVKIGAGGTQCTNYPSPLFNQETVYIITVDGNHLKFATSQANAMAGTAIPITTQGDSDGMITISVHDPRFGSLTAPNNIDTTKFPNGYHRLESWSHGNSTAMNTPITASLQFSASAVNAGSNAINVNNHPFVEGDSVNLTAGGALPGGITSPCTVHVIDQNDFNCQGQTITSQGSGTNTANWNVAMGQFAIPASMQSVVMNSGYGTLSPNAGAEVTRLDFENGNARMELRPQYQRVYLTAGETVNFGAYYANCDGSTTAVSANSLLYGVKDSTIATVSSSGVITGGSASTTFGPLETFVVAIDNTNAFAAVLQVYLVADHTNFKHLSVGHGVLNTYTPGQSLWMVSTFFLEPSRLVYPPFPGDEPAAWLKYSGINTLENVNNMSNFASAGSGYTSYSQWLTEWQMPADPGLVDTGRFATVVGQLAHGNFAGLGIDSLVCGGQQALKTDAWRQQAYSKQESDLAPYEVARDMCDETDSHRGPLGHPQPQIASNSDGVNANGSGRCASAGSCGLISVTVTGCPSTPCTGTGTVSYVTYDKVQSGVAMYFWGATNPALNGCYYPLNITYDTTDPISNQQRVTSFQIRTVNVVNGTYNASTDPGLNAEALYGGYFGYFSPEATFNWSTGPTSVTVAGSNCSTSICTATFTWTAHPFVNAQIIGLNGFVNSAWRDPTGATGLYPVTVVDANHFTVLAVNVPAGTYNSSTDAGAQFQESWQVSQLPDANYSFNIASGYLTAHAPTGFALTAGGSLPSQISWMAGSGLSQYNSIYQSWTPEVRWGSLAFDVLSTFNGVMDATNGLSGPHFNYYGSGPFIMESQLSGATCYIQNPTYYCDMNPGLSRYAVNSPGPGNIFLETMWPAAWGWASGLRMYGFMSDYYKAGYYGFWSPANPSSNQSQTDYIDSQPDNWMAAAEVNNFIERNAKYILSPPANTPYYGPLVMSGVHKIPSGGGTIHIVGNWSEEAQAVTVNLSQFELGGPVRKEYITPHGTAVTSLSPATATDICTMSYASACGYIFQPSGATDDLTYTTFSFNRAQFNASKVALEIHYYPKDNPLAIYDCTSACTVPADLNGKNGFAPVWYRYTYLAADGSVLARSDLQRFK